MSEPFLGEIRLVGFTFAPEGWFLCEGQILPIAEYTALFSLLGTTYGGNGTTTFALPDLRGRVPVGFGQGLGLQPYTQGEVYGLESVTLDFNSMPEHTHSVNASGNNGNHTSPIGNFPSTLPGASISATAYNTGSTGVMNAGMISQAGGNQPHENRQPSLVLNWIIAINGIYPSRN
jgi:microcystin-dependent protein